MKPLTRKEQFFNYILGKTTSKPKPMTREEKILDEFKPTMVVNMVKVSGKNMVTVDKTFTKIINHIKNGGEVTALWKGSTGANPICMYLQKFDDFSIAFVGYSVIPQEDGTLESLTIHSVYIFNDDITTYAKAKLSIS